MTKKHLCVVVKVAIPVPFIIVVYYTDSVKKRSPMGEEIRVWYDQEGDYLEVIFERKKGFFRETENDAVMEKVDENGKILGFSISDIRSSK